MSRVTITTRHTGRICVGLDAEAFAAIYGFIVFTEGVRKTMHIAAPEGKLGDAEKRVADAFHKFASEIKSPSVPSVTSC
jgi:hypothetical protein